MKRLLPFLLAFSLAGTARAHEVPKPRVAVQPTETVYVCMSPSSYAYHSSDKCNGLGRCTHEVKTMSAADAQGLGKRACRKCY